MSIELYFFENDRFRVRCPCSRCKRGRPRFESWTTKSSDFSKNRLEAKKVPRLLF